MIRLQLCVQHSYPIHIHTYIHTTHILAQVKEICNFVNSGAKDKVAVVCATLNATPESDEVRALTGKAPAPVKDLVFVDAWEAAGEGDGHTWSMCNPVSVHACVIVYLFFV